MPKTFFIFTEAMAKKPKPIRGQARLTQLRKFFKEPDSVDFKTQHKDELLFIVRRS